MTSLRAAKTNKQICALDRDNLHVGPGDRWGILVSESEVYLSEQVVGASPTQRFSIPRRFFDRFIDFYMAEQKSDAVQKGQKATRKKIARRSGHPARPQTARGRGRKQAL